VRLLVAAAAAAAATPKLRLQAGEQLLLLLPIHSSVVGP
jgi:hypothetical protein